MAGVTPTSRTSPSATSSRSPSRASTTRLKRATFPERGLAREYVRSSSSRSCSRRCRTPCPSGRRRKGSGTSRGVFRERQLELQGFSPLTPPPASTRASGGGWSVEQRMGPPRRARIEQARPGEPDEDAPRRAGSRVMSGRPSPLRPRSDGRSGSGRQVARYRAPITSIASGTRPGFSNPPLRPVMERAAARIRIVKRANQPMDFPMWCRARCASSCARRTAPGGTEPTVEQRVPEHHSFLAPGQPASNAFAWRACR